jgi:hypothetical protein
MRDRGKPPVPSVLRVAASKIRPAACLCRALYLADQGVGSVVLTFGAYILN